MLWGSEMFTTLLHSRVWERPDFKALFYLFFEEKTFPGFDAMYFGDFEACILLQLLASTSIVQQNGSTLLLKISAML